MLQIQHGFSLGRDDVLFSVEEGRRVNDKVSSVF